MACNRIPVEVWDIILGHLDARTIKSLRLTNKRGLHDLAIDSCWGSFVERLSLCADKHNPISALQSNNSDDRLPCVIEFSIPVDNELFTSQSGHSLEANDATWSLWETLARGKRKKEQLELNKWFFDTLVEAFRALNKVKEISFWEDEPRRKRWWSHYLDTARLYYLTTAAILESNIVLDCFQLHFVSETGRSLPALFAVPFYSRGTPYSMLAVTTLLDELGRELHFRDALKGRMPSLFSHYTGLPDPGEQIPPKVKPEASNIRCLQANIYRAEYGSPRTEVFTELIRCLEFACVDHVLFRNARCVQSDLLLFLKEARTIRHLELSKLKLGCSGSWGPVLNFVATDMASLQSLTLGHLQTCISRSIPLLLVDEDPRDFPELTGDPNDASFSRTLSSAELARGLNFRGPDYRRGGRWEF